MARRCTIQLPYGRATLLESYADYFIVGGYEEQPYQIDIYERNKTNALCLKVDVELKRLCRMKSMQQKEIRQLTRMLVPRLRWSDRLSERLESRRRLLSTDQEQSKTYLGLRKLLFIGNCSNPSIGSQKKADTEVFFFLFNAQSKKPDKLKIVAQLKDANQISSISYGPYDNGHLIVGLQTGQLLGFNIVNNFEQIFQITLCSSPLTSISFDPTQLILVTSEASNKVYAVSLIKKQFEYIYLDLGRKQYCTVRLDHQKEKETLEKNAR